MLEYSSSSDKEEADKRWDDIGIQLEVDDQRLNYIRGHDVRRARDAFRSMISTWVKQKKPQPTWLNFVEALDRLNMCKNLSTHLRTNYCKLIIYYNCVPKQVCLMSQSWDNVANMHELITVSSHTKI